MSFTQTPPFSSCDITFWELKDCVQWYNTSLSLENGLGSIVGSWLSSPSVTLPSSSMAEMGHQLQLVGVTWLEDAMTEDFVRVRGYQGGSEREREGETDVRMTERERGGRGRERERAGDFSTTNRASLIKRRRFSQSLSKNAPASVTKPTVPCKRILEAQSELHPRQTCSEAWEILGICVLHHREQTCAVDTSDRRCNWSVFHAKVKVHIPLCRFTTYFGFMSPNYLFVCLIICLKISQRHPHSNTMPLTWQDKQDMIYDSVPTQYLMYFPTVKLQRNIMLNEMCEKKNLMNAAHQEREPLRLFPDFTVYALARESVVGLNIFSKWVKTLIRIRL